MNLNINSNSVVGLPQGCAPLYCRFWSITVYIEFGLCNMCVVVDKFLIANIAHQSPQNIQLHYLFN